MAAFPLLTHSRRAILLGGVSLLALQGIAGCVQKPATLTPAYSAPSADTTSGGLSSQVDGGVYTQIGPLPEETGGAEPIVPATGTTVTTLAVGEEDGTGPIPVEPDGGIGDGAGPPPFLTTEAVGEEDGGGVYTPGDTGTVTTLAIGEEDGGAYTPTEPPTATTLAVGEEDGGSYTPTDPGTPTTLAIGEEDGGVYTPTDPGIVTTLAIGEEDGGLPMPVEPDGGIGDGAGPIPLPVDPYGSALGEDAAPAYEEPMTVTTLAIGEEG